MDFSFLDSLELAAYRVELRLIDPVQCHFFHGPALNGLLCNALNRHPLGPEVVLIPVESARLSFRPGEVYGFGLVLVGHCPDLAGQIEKGLRALGQCPHEEKTFGRFEVQSFESVALALKPGEPSEEVTLQLVTPLRMEREDGIKGKRFLGPDYFSPDRFLRLLHDRVYDLCKLSGADLPAYQVPEIPPTAVTKTSLIWIDAPYHRRRKTFGGVVGSIQLKVDLSEDWGRLLAVGQILGAGRNTAFGFGQYRLIPAVTPIPFKRSRSFLELAIAPENMVEAFGHVKLKQGMPGSDSQSIESFARDLLVNLDDLTRSLARGTYQSGPLSGVVLPKATGKIRALAIPTVRDRIVQRAVTQILGPAFDVLLEESSFAYRKGLSRAGAAQAIARAYEQGYRYILESDIESFFDNVDWEVLEEKLRALLYDDPIVELLMGWVKQKVIFEGQPLNRTQGLPQGAVISPLLSNLYLDEFDEALQDDFRLIRYCDDFVVLCKSKQQAQAALEKAKEALQALELEIKPAKTRIVDFNQGFQYLGYIFCRSAIVEVKKDAQDTKAIPLQDLSPEQIPPHHWLTHCDLNAAQTIKPPPTKEPVSLAANDHQADDKFPVYLSAPDILARLSGQTLVLTHPEQNVTEDVKIPFQNILAVIDYGKPSMTLPAVVKLAQSNISTYFQDYSGKTTLTIPARLPNYGLWTRQMAFREQAASLTRFCRAVVSSKIHNYRVICTRRDWENKVIDELKDLEEKCDHTDDIASLRGYEGRAAAVYFQCFGRQVANRWGFAGRVKHPPTDPINSMLSLGYSGLYHHISTALQICELNPTIGWFHEPRNDYNALACDLQEEFRHLVDSQVLSLINHNQVTPEDFKRMDKGPLPLLMTFAFRKVFLAQMEERLMTEFKPDTDSDHTLSYRRFFIRQARQIQNLCFHGDQEYQPLRIH